MIDVGVIGSNSTRRTNELIEATIFYAKSLMPPEVVDALEIDVIISHDLTHAGCAYPDVDDVNPRSFIIELNPKYADPSIYSTLAHEMVHVKQWAMGEANDRLGVDGGDIVIQRMWQGKEWTPGDNEDYYFDCPWEIEAFGREVGLYYRWRNRNSK